MKQRIIFLIFFGLIWALSSIAENTIEPQNVTSGTQITYTSANQKGAFIPDPQLAMSTAEYPVTAGDVYQLGFVAGSTQVIFSIVIDTSYKIKVANLAVLDISGKTFLEVKSLVESIVSKNYPLSGVQFILKNPATFTVVVKGEVNMTSEVNAWGLSRLSSVINPVITSYGSTRNVMVTSNFGKTKIYDLFRATRFGDLGQDPYVRPGDIITVQKCDRQVEITGAVQRPGRYQLLTGEGLNELINTYAAGFNQVADTSRIELSRYVDSVSKTGNKMYISDYNSKSQTILKNLDVVTVPTTLDQQPILYVEGSITSPSAILSEPSLSTQTTQSSTNQNPQSSMRLQINFQEGEQYGSMVWQNRSWFSAKSDTANSYVVREGKQIPINLDHFLYGANDDQSLVIQTNDTLVVPFKQNLANVTVLGEVKTTLERPGWPLTRLSDIVANNLTDYSSIRDIQVTTANNEVFTYDLFKATRFGDFTQNPYIKPGELVTIARYSRQITIEGAVERPGTYQLLEGENLLELVNYYGGGCTPVADNTRLEIVRYIDSDSKSGNKIYVNMDEAKDPVILKNYDHITIPTIVDLLPVMFVEGAIGVSTKTEITSSTRMPVRFNPGENYASLVQKNQAWFTAVSDTANSYIIRNGKNIPLNINPMLYDATYRSQYYVEQNDVLMIPFRQYFVSVSGAVAIPGRYPYIPDRGWEYYVGLAGGFLSSQNSYQALTITDVSGKKLKKTDVISPETNIEAQSNAFLYYFNQYAPIVTTTLSIISTLLTAWALTR